MNPVEKCVTTRGVRRKSVVYLVLVAAVREEVEEVRLRDLSGPISPRKTLEDSKIWNTCPYHYCYCEILYLKQMSALRKGSTWFYLSDLQTLFCRP